MSAIVTAVLKATVGLLLTKGRDCLAKKLQEGDVTDEQFRNMIVRELDDIKSKLDGLARKDLLTSISFFKEGIVFLSTVLDKKYYANCGPESSKVKTRDETAEYEKDKSTERLDLLTADVKTVSLVKGQETLFAELDESGKRALADAKKRFDEARMKATEAFNNVALSTKDRILAMQYRVMSTILEKIDSPAEAIATCKLCLEELHSMPAVVKSFEVEYFGGFWSMFKKDERKDITNSVQEVNCAVARVTAAVDGVLSKQFDNWPGVTEKKINLIKDDDKAETWSFSFGHEGKGKQKLDCPPKSITTNSHGDFIIAERSFFDLKVFNQDGKLWKLLTPDPAFSFHGPIVDVVTDHLDNVYVLFKSEVHVIYSQPPKHRTFHLQEWNVFEGLSLTVNKKEDIFVLVKFNTGRGYYNSIVQVYDKNGQFKYTFGDKKGWKCIIAIDDGFISQHRFPAGIDLLDALGKFRRRICLHVDVMAVHFRTNHLITARNFSNALRITIHETNGDFVRNICVAKNDAVIISGMAVTPDGRIAILCTTTEYSEDGETLQSVVHVL
ncbi:uncharacterized protein [Porites lutea]|uniref:uncharacterized protein n=1 Tax=Porites lutea TaxID=51062 RepID=UPI003CC54025